MSEVMVGNGRMREIVGAESVRVSAVVKIYLPVYS
jgi:hypothetical protein